MFRGCGHRWHHGAQVFAVTLTQLAQPGRGFRHLDQPAQTMAVGAVAEVPQHPARRHLAVASASICRVTAGGSAKTVIRRIRKALSGSSPCESFIARTGHLPAPGQRRPEAGLPVKAAQATGTAFVEDRHHPGQVGLCPADAAGTSDVRRADRRQRSAGADRAGGDGQRRAGSGPARHRPARPQPDAALVDSARPHRTWPGSCRAL